MPDRLCLLCVHAHPDDEASKGAPTVARYHAEGVRTVLVCCTGGEEGDILNPAMDTPEVRADIGRIRMAELKAATDIIGYDETVLLGYRDSGMPDSEANKRPDSFAQAPLDEAVGRLVAVIRRERPQVIVTYGDNQNEYPHPDHLRVHEISVVAFDAAGDPDRFRGAGPPFTPAKLYYSVWSGERFRQIHEKYGELGLTSPFDDKWLARMTRTEPFTTTIDVAGFTEVRGAALESSCDPGRSRLAVLVRPPARGHARHPSVRRVPSGPEPRRPDRRHRGRPLRGGPLRLRPDQAVGPRKPQLITPALCNSTSVTAVASRASNTTVATTFHDGAGLLRARILRRRSSREGPAGVAGPDAAVVAAPAAVRITASRSSTLQPGTTSGVVAPPPCTVSSTPPRRSSTSHCDTRSHGINVAARPGRLISMPSVESAMSKTSAGSGAVP